MLLPVFLFFFGVGESKAVRGTPKQSKRPAARKLAPEPKRARIAQVSSEEEEEGIPRRKAKRLKSDSEDELVKKSNLLIFLY